MSFEAFLGLALRKHRPEIVHAVARTNFLRRAILELPVTGVPDVSTVEVFAWPHPVGRARTVVTDIVAANRAPLAAPITHEIVLQADEAGPLRAETAPIIVDARTRTEDDETVVRVGNCTWRRVGPGKQQEVIRLMDDGTPVLQTIDTSKYPYRLTCTCGRVRYARRNSLHQIVACRVCTCFERARQKALRQYRARRGVS